MQEVGPIYSVPLIDTLPLDGGMFQAMPSRDDLEACSKRFMRVAAAYEVLLCHYQRCLKMLGRDDPVQCHACGAIRERVEIQCGQCGYKIDGSDLEAEIDDVLHRRQPDAN